MVLFFASNDFFLASNDFVCVHRNDYVYLVWQDTKVVQYFSKTGAFKSLENPSIQTWIQTLLSRKIPDIELQKKGIAGENWISSRRENHDCSCWIGHNHISSWENKILPCPARVCWKTFYSQSIDNIMICGTIFLCDNIMICGEIFLCEKNNFTFLPHRMYGDQIKHWYVFWGLNSLGITWSLLPGRNIWIIFW